MGSNYRKYNSLEEVWDRHENKLCVYVMEAVDLAGKYDVYCKALVGKKTIGKTKTAKKTSDPKWDELFFGCDLDPSDYLILEVYQDNSYSPAFLGQASIAHLQTIQPHDEVIDKWVELKPRQGKKDIVSGKIHVRYLYSLTPESRALLKNRHGEDDIHLYSYYRHLFKTGDLISYSAPGILSSITKLVTNAPFSQVGLILKLPNKYTHQEELYLLEVTRNIDQFVDVFTEEKNSGVNIFRLIERLHQFPGHAIWWSPLNRPSDDVNTKAMLEWLWNVYKNGKNFTAKETQKQNSKDPTSKETLRATGPALQLLTNKFGFGKNYSDLCELASCDLVSKCLIRLGQISSENVPYVPSPVEIINFPCYGKPVIIRVKKKYFSESMLPPGVTLMQLEKSTPRPQELLQPPLPVAAVIPSVDAQVMNAPQVNSDPTIKQPVNPTGTSSSPSLPTPLSTPPALSPTPSPTPSATTSPSTSMSATTPTPTPTPISTATSTSRSRETEKSVSSRKDTRSGSYAITDATLDLSDENLIQVMKKGTKVTRYYPQKNPTVKKLYLSDDETELYYGRGTIISVQDIEEVRLGQHTSVFDINKKTAASLDSLSLSVIYGKLGRDSHTFDISFASDTDWKYWANGLRLLVAKQRYPDLAYITKVYSDMQKPRLTLDVTLRFLSLLNFKAPRALIAEKFEHVDANENGFLELDEFIRMLRMLEKRTEIKELFTKYSGGSRLMTPSQLLNFLQVEQRDTFINNDNVMNIIMQFSQNKGTVRKGLKASEFEAFLTSAFNHVLVLKTSVTEDMSQPLSHYYISSSHNTYLAPHQLCDRSPKEAYIRILKRGCRCIELECWDGDDGEPVVHYGGVNEMTKLKFRDVIKTINKYAFYESPYPLILSIEQHCSPPQQIQMAKILQEQFGESLRLANTRTQTDKDGFLPSPRFLKEKIIVKGKLLISLESGNTSNGTKKKEKIAEELAQVFYLKAAGFPGFKQIIAKGRKPWESPAFSDEKMIVLVKKAFGEFVEHNKKYLSRIYPHGNRFDSTNYNPLPAWSVGAQMVALNWHSPGEEVWVQEALFSSYGLFQTTPTSDGFLRVTFPTLGYVLKPLHLRSERNEPQTNKYKLIRVRIFNGRHLPAVEGKESCDPYVELSVRGHAQDEKSYKTQVEEGNGYCPEWDETFEFPLTQSHSAILIFVVYDKSTSKRLAHYSVMVESIRPGYRVVPLRDDSGAFIPLANLFCHFYLS
jgi:phosphatidylinositol phospholipase C delta